MRIRDCNWMQVAALLQAGEDRAVLPLGSIELHATLSLAVDALLAEQVAVEAAEPLGVPVFPAQPCGFTPSYLACPGTLGRCLGTRGRRAVGDRAHARRGPMRNAGLQPALRTPWRHLAGAHRPGAPERGDDQNWYEAPSEIRRTVLFSSR